MKVLDRPENIRPWMEDESKKSGTADRVFFPETEAGVREILQNTEGPVTVQGGLTGVTAGAVPDGGIVINLSGMTGILTEPDLRAANPRITVQPGLRLCSLREYLQRLDLFFAPDPTETTATLGGMVSCDSSGARSFHYGATRNHVRSIRVVLADGDVLCMQRGQYRSNGNAFRHVRKHTAGYYIRPDMDLMDLFIGSEGTLGIVTEIGLDLLPLPAHLMGAVIFFPEETSAVRFTRFLRENAGGEISESGTRLPFPTLAIEFFGTDTLFMLRSAQETGTVLTDLPHIPKGCAVYTEFASDDRSDLPSLVHGPADLQFQFRGLAELIRMAGGMPDSSWVAFRGPDMERLKAFRHAAPVCASTKGSASSGSTARASPSWAPTCPSRTAVSKKSSTCTALTFRRKVFRHRSSAISETIIFTATSCPELKKSTPGARPFTPAGQRRSSAWEAPSPRSTASAS